MLLVLSGRAAAQGTSLSVLKEQRQRLANYLPDTTRVRLLTTLCYELREEETARAVGYGEAGVALARTLPAQEQEPLLLQALLSLSSCYANLSNGPEALRLLSEAEQLARHLHDYDALVRTHSNQGSIYHSRGDTATAWNHYRNGLLLINNSAAAGITPRTQMKLLGNLGSLCYMRNQTAKALHFDSLALGMARRSRDSTAEATYLSSLAAYLMQAGQLPRVRRLLLQSLAISQRQHAVRNQAELYAQLATFYTKTSDPEQANASALQALMLARHSRYLECALDALGQLGALAARSGNYRQAYDWNTRYVALNDSLNSRQTTQTLATAQVSYETQERARRLRQLTAEQAEQAQHTQLLVGAVALLAMVLLVVIYLYRNLRLSRSELAANNRALESASDQLRAVALFKDKLYAIVAHDLRGPVTAFAGVTSLIDTYIAHNDQAGLAQLPGMVRQAADSLNHLLDNVLNWAVSQTGELECRPVVLGVSEMFDECQALYQTTAAASWQHITATASPGLRLLADRNMTRTILRNLVGNALKFTPSGGHVHLDASPDPDDPRMVLLSCTDTGPGMSATTVSAITSGPALPEPTPEPALPGVGLGLGLALCRAFVHRHGGTLVIQSRPGAGTNVTVSLPRAK
ncbi:MAG: ATP-binding protein [Bacteroidota bacterium]|nr:ATP-binding protein [Bacteroidota bacterium]